MATITGQVDEGYGAIADAFAANFSDHGDVGAGFCLYVGGKPVVDLTGGVADPRTGRAYDADTLQLVFSTTKGAAAICAAILHERGELDYDAPVAEYWPEFAAGGKEAMTVGWMMSHRGGLATVDEAPPLAEVLAVDPIVERLAAQSPLWEQDGSHGYHALTYGWLVGELIRRISGQRIGAFLQDNIAAPLGLEFWIGLPEEQEARVAPLLSSPPPTDPAAVALMEALMGLETLGGRALSLSERVQHPRGPRVRDPSGKRRHECRIAGPDVRGDGRRGRRRAVDERRNP
jgi:CubicO group peptidase (beta-lactamase class C family)